MEKKNEKRRLRIFQPYELGAMEEYLAQMAAKGWFVSGRSSMRWTFQKGEARRLRYCVDIFVPSEDGEEPAGEQTQEYLFYCETAGWRHVFSDGAYHFFCAEDEGAVPVQTDDGRRMREIVKCTLRERWYLWFMMLAVQLFVVWQRTRWLEESPAEAVQLNGITVGFMAVHLLLILEILIDIFRFLRFAVGNMLRTRRGEPWKYYSLREAGCYSFFPWVCTALMVMVPFGMNRLQTEQWAAIAGNPAVEWESAANAKSGANAKSAVNAKTGASAESDVAAESGASAESGVAAESDVTGGSAPTGNALLDERVVTSKNGNTEIIMVMHGMFGGSDVYQFFHDEIPYTLEDAGIIPPKKAYRNSECHEDSGLYYRHLSYSDGYRTRLEGGMCEAISYEVFWFSDEEKQREFLKDTYLDKKQYELAEQPEEAKRWGRSPSGWP